MINFNEAIRLLILNEEEGEIHRCLRLIATQEGCYRVLDKGLVVKRF